MINMIEEGMKAPSLNVLETEEMIAASEKTVNDPGAPKAGLKLQDLETNHQRLRYM